MIRKAFYFFIMTFCFGSSTCAQITSGLTRIPDTSYNVQSEYKKHLKNHPYIRVATESPLNYIRFERNIPFCKTKEKELKIDAIYPDEKKGLKKKAIIFIHGGGWRSGNKEMHHPLLKELANLGYVCFSPEYRLSTEALYPAAIHDIKSAIRWVRKNAKRFNIDVNKIIVAGHSSGGQLAAFMGATNGMKKFEGDGCELKTSSMVNAIINLDGTLAFIHPESGEGDDSKKISAATYWFGYSKTEKPDLWKDAAPLTHTGKHSPPIQFINSGVERMHAGRDDLIRILKQHNIYSEVKTFDGAPHTFLLFHPWFDSVVVYMDRFIKTVFPPGPKAARRIVVAKEGNGDFRTVQEAINSVPLNNIKWTEIFIKNGIYKEKILIDSTRPYILLVGENKLTTILSWNDHTGKISPKGDTINTRTSWSFKIKANNFTARDITFENNAGFTAGQAVAVESNGDKAAFFNCRFIGNQDVLFTNAEQSRQYYENCYIEGTTDFIFGSSTAWFERCHVHSKKNSHVTAASTPKGQYGYVFNRCMLTGDSGLSNVSLGRPWRPYSHVTYLNSFIGSHIKPEGWSAWNNNDNHTTAIYNEYNSYGRGANVQQRIRWSRQLDNKQVARYNIENILGTWQINK